VTFNGEVLSVARRARGITQEQLTEAAGVTQAALSRYENSLREPDAAVLGRLAAALGVTEALLVGSQKIRGAMAVDAHMRRRATASARQWRRLEARLNMHRLHVRQVMEEVELRTDTQLPLLDPIDIDPAGAARIVRMQWRLPVGPVHSLVGWLESAGCIVIEEDFGTRRVDGLSQWVAGHPVILVNSGSPTDRKRLTLAHELGHLVLHSEWMTEEPERDANQFAAEFLMPADVIRPQLRRLSLGRLHELKRAWMVSMQALVERAYGLGVLPRSERTRFYKQFSARGWRKSEPLSEQLPPERPALAAEIGQAMRAQGLSDDEIAAICGYAGESDDNPFLPRDRALRAL